MGLYPPWIGTIGMLGKANTTVRRAVGYHSILTAPGPTDKTTFNTAFGDVENYDAYDYESYYQRKVPKLRDTLRYEIDATRLLLEWLMVVLVTGGLVIAARYTVPKSMNEPANPDTVNVQSPHALKLRSMVRYLRSPRTYILLLSTVACLAVT
jgi:hypothetical protein